MNSGSTFVPGNAQLDGITRMLFALRNRHLFALDLMSWFVTAILALVLRVDSFDVFARFVNVLAAYILVASVCRFIIFRWFGLYSRFWRYASIDELAQIFLAAGTATVVLTGVFVGIIPLFNLFAYDLPRSIPMIDGILVFIAAGGLRYSVRLIERLRQRRHKHGRQQTRVIIFGAGDAGTAIVREMQKNPELGLEPIAFLDTDPHKHGTWILGVPVISDRDDLRVVVERYRVQQAIIAMPSAPGKTIRELIQVCHAADLPVKTVPGISELLDDSVTINQLRQVEITDLLRREPIQLDTSPVLALIDGKRVLITGAGGSIGSELCRQIARCSPAALILVGHGETSLFYTTNELRQSFPDLVLKTIIADVRDFDRMRCVVERYQPHLVFHAAAHKHVPLMEENVEDAVTNNVLGTRNIVRLALANQVQHFVMISTDKAVNPTNVMGATKRVAELIVREAATMVEYGCFVVVRFGNVLGSRGSVVPLFKKQIAQGGPVTVTHPEARRYFMTIPEAVQLVLQAATIDSRCGDVFVLDMGEQVKVVDLARDLIRLSGLEEGRDIDIVFTGLRQGEKLSEELFGGDEKYDRTKYEKIFVARNGVHPISLCWNPDLAMPTSLQANVETLIAAARAGNVAATQNLLKVIVPEYQPVETIQTAQISKTSSLEHIQ